MLRVRGGDILLQDREEMQSIPRQCSISTTTCEGCKWGRDHAPLPFAGHKEDPKNMSRVGWEMGGGQRHSWDRNTLKAPVTCSKVWL